MSSGRECRKMTGSTLGPPLSSSSSPTSQSSFLASCTPPSPVRVSGSPPSLSSTGSTFLLVGDVMHGGSRNNDGCEISYDPSSDVERSHFRDEGSVHSGGVDDGDDGDSNGRGNSNTVNGKNSGSGSPIVGCGAPSKRQRICGSLDLDKGTPPEWPRLSAVQCVVFHPCENQRHVHHPPASFSPLFTHHFFGESESIIGFDSLKIHIFFSPDTFDAFIKLEGKPSPLCSDAEAVRQHLHVCLFERTPFPGGFCPSQAEFLRKLKDRPKNFIPPGVVVGEVMTDEGFLQLRECGFVLPDRVGFLALHRRMEWFLHWFIESASQIDQDESWRVLLPYIVRKKNHVRVPWRTCVDVKNAMLEALRIEADKRAGRADVDEVCKPSFDPDSLFSRLQPSPHRSSRSKDAASSPLSLAPSEIPFDPSSPESTFRRRSRKSERQGMGEAVVHVKRAEETSDKELESEEQPHSILSPEDRFDVERGCTWHLAGFATTYTFFTIQKDRRRISQFMVFPHVQSKGLGIKMLEHIYIDAILNSAVCELTVEDPAPSFTQLRDVVALKLCIGSGVLPKSLLGGTCSDISMRSSGERKRAIGEKLDTRKSRVMPETVSAPALVSSSDVPDVSVLVALTKETPRQAIRMQDTLRLALLLPDPLPHPPLELFTTVRASASDESDGFLSRDWRAAVNVAPIGPEPCENAETSAGLSSDGVELGDCLSSTETETKRSTTACQSSGSSSSTSRSSTSTCASMDQGASASNCNLSVPTQAAGPAASTDFADSLDCRSFRLLVKKRLRKEHLDALTSVNTSLGVAPAGESSYRDFVKTELQRLWRERYCVYYRTVRKLRAMFSP